MKKTYVTRTIWLPILKKSWFGLWKVIRWDSYTFSQKNSYKNGVLLEE